MSAAIETLNSTGFLFTETAGAWSILSADFGDGYESHALVGDPAGLRSWTIKIDVIPGELAEQAAAFLLLEDGGFLLLEDGGFFELESEPLTPRANYLWRFFRMSKAADNAPFWIEFDDPADGLRKKFLASFVDDRLSYQVLCARVYATGLQLQQRRQVGVISPVLVET